MNALALPDLRQPWWAPYAGAARPVFASLAQGAAVHQALAAQPPPIDLAAGPLRFVAPASCPPGEAYEAFIARSACVPSRHNLHDLFNGLVWFSFPHIKRRLNELQAEEIARAGVGASRGPLRDALTLLDENGALLDGPAPLCEALLARDWRALFITRRPLWNQARIVVFGHALLEKLATSPRKALTAHVLLTPPGLPCGTGASADFEGSAWAEAIDGPWLAGKPFAPLPLLGIPGWCPENGNFSFYDDSDVFRPRRTPEERTTREVLHSRSA
jgi:hypothetical protein